jgi:hypothetical protein
MNQSDFIQYAEGFVQECLDRGLSEDQTDQFFQQMVYEDGHVKSAAFGLGKLWRGGKAIGRYVAPRASPGTGTAGVTAQYTPSAIGGSVFRAGLVGGAGLGAYSLGIKPAWNSFRPGTGSGGPVAIPQVPGGYTGGNNQGGAGGRSDNATAALREVYGRPVETSRREGFGGTGATSTGGTVFDRETSRLQTDLQGVDRRIFDATRELRQAEQNRGTNTGDIARTQALRQELESLNAQRNKMTPELDRANETYRNQQRRYTQQLSRAREAASNQMASNDARLQRQLYFNDKEQGAWYSPSRWAWTAHNRLRGFSPDTLHQTSVNRDIARENYRAAGRAPENPYMNSY